MLRSIIHRLPMGWSAKLALMRIASQWQSLLTIVVGVLLAASIGANIPLYTTAIAQVGMVQRLEQLPPEDVHIASRISLTALEFDGLDSTWTAIDAVVKAHTQRTFDTELPGWVDAVVGWSETAPMRVVLDGEDIEATRMRVAYYEGWTDTEQTITVVEGALPAEPTDPEIDLEAALGLEASILLGLSVGDEITLDQRGWDTSIPVRARITAIVRERDDGSVYWMPDSPLRTQGAGEWQLETNLLTTRDSFLRIATEFIPQTRSLLGWRVLFDHSGLPFSQIPEAIAVLEGYEEDLQTLLNAPEGRRVNFVYSTNLRLPQAVNDPDHPLEEYAIEVTTLNTPFSLLLLQIGALALFFLFVTAALVRRGERREIAMLQSRGAFDRQLILVRGVEALVIAAFGAMLAPFVARQLLVWLAPVFTGIDQLPLLLNPTVFVFASVAAAAAFVALMGTLRPVLRLPLIMAGGSAIRSEKQSWWQRYYVDVILAVVGLGALIRLVAVDSPLASTQLGSRIGDPLLLLAPALLFLALGSLLLRLFPGIMSLLARFFAGRVGLTGALATWQVSREPVHYGRITFLLTLAIGIGWFATSFRATVDRSHGDQARYSVGTDVRLEEHNFVLDADRARSEAFYNAMPEAQYASAVLRFVNTDVSTDLQSPTPGEVLAINADTFGDVVYWRSDLGPIIAPRPSGQPIELPTPGRALPFVPDRVGFWARIDQQAFGFSAATLYRPDLDRLLRLTEISLRLRDDSGSFMHVPMEVVEVEWARLGTDRPGLQARSFNTTGWVYFEGSLSGLDYVPQGEVRLESIYWQHRGRNPNFENDLRFSLASMTLIEADGTVRELGWLTGDGWTLLQDWGAPANSLTSVAVAPDRPNLRSRRVIFDQVGRRSVWGLVLDYPEPPVIPAIVSQSLMDLNNLILGDNLQLLDLERVSPRFQVVDVMTHYPTLYQENRPFLVVDRDALLYALNRRPSASVYSAEMWLRLAPGVSSAQFVNDVDVEGDSTALLRAQTLDDTMHTLQTNPLALGLLGLLFLAFIVALALSVVGLLTYAALTAQNRRNQFGVLRALGMSSIRLVLSIALEQALVMGTAVILGVFLGTLLSDQVVPTLALGATGEAITPPFVVQVEAAALLQYSAVMLMVLVVVLAASLLLVRRLSLAQTLRLGEE